MKNVFVVKSLLYEQDAIFHHPYFGNPVSDQHDPDLATLSQQGHCMVGQGQMFSEKVISWNQRCGVV